MSTLVTTWLSNITFHLLPIWLQTLVVIDSESRLKSFPCFCAPPCEVAVLFHSNLSRRPFLGRVVDLGLLLCTGFDSQHAVCSYVIFLRRDHCLRPMTNRKIERMMGAALPDQRVPDLPDQRVVKVYSLLNHSINCVELEFIQVRY